MSDQSSPRGGTLARTFQAVVDAQRPPPDDWDVVRRRVAGGDSGGTVVLAPAGPERRRSRHLLAAAAILVAVGGLAATIAVVADHSDEGQVHTGAAPATEPPATGWYLPQDLPAGWTLDEVVMTRVDEPCPCRVATWADDDRSTSIHLNRWRVPPGTTSPPADQLADPPTPVDLGAVQGARLATMDDGWRIEWYSGEAAFNVSVAGIDRSEAEAIGRAFVADPNRTTSPVEGLALVADVPETGATGRSVLVSVHLTTPAGHEVGYTLSRPSDEAHSGPFEVVDVPGQPLPLRRNLARPTQVESFPSDGLVGRWPGASIEGKPHLTDGPLDAATDAEERTMLGSLRPATATQWQAYVASADEHDPRLDDAPTLESLLDLPAG